MQSYLIHRVLLCIQDQGSKCSGKSTITRYHPARPFLRFPIALLNPSSGKPKALNHRLRCGTNDY